MTRIAGVNLPEQKKIEIALTAIYGIGRKTAGVVLEKARVNPDKKVKDLKEEETVRLQKTVEKNFLVEGDLRQTVEANIRRLKVIGTYRGIRHSRNLPVRGQRTRSNARTKRGKKKTVGAMKKEQRIKMQKAGKGEKKEGKK